MSCRTGIITGHFIRLSFAQVLEINRQKANTLKPQALGKPLKVARMFRRFGSAFLDLPEEDVILEYLQELERIYLASFRSMHQKNIELMSVMLRNETWESARISPQVSTGRFRCSVLARDGLEEDLPLNMNDHVRCIRT